MLIAENNLRTLIREMIDEQFKIEDTVRAVNTVKDYLEIKKEIEQLAGERVLAVPASFAKVFGISIEKATVSLNNVMRKMFPEPDDRKEAYKVLAVTAPPLVAAAAALYASKAGKILFKGASTLFGMFMFATAGPFLMYQLVTNLPKVETKLVNLRKLTQNDEPLSKKHIKAEREEGEYKGVGAFGITPKDYTYREFITVLAAQNVDSITRDAGVGTGENLVTRLYNNDVISDEMYKDVLKMTYSIRNDVKAKKKSLADVRSMTDDAFGSTEDLALKYVTAIDQTKTSTYALNLWKALV